MRLVRTILIWLALAGAAGSTAAQTKPPLVLAASSLQEALTAAADFWARQGHPRPVLSFAASSALARQVEAGAPADLFVSADQEWMDALDTRGLIVRSTRVSFLGNRLVIVEPASAHSRIPVRPPAAVVRSLGGEPLAMADPDSVPAGKYGKAALERLGAWSGIAPRVVRAENVRAALALVERGAAPKGIVYATDAKASSAVRIAGVFPDWTHPPITYPVARLTASRSPEAEPFRRFLTSAQGMAIFARYGFTRPRRR